MSAHYKAAVCTSLSGPGAIEIREYPARALSPGEVRIAVKAAGLNFPDLLMTYGGYQFRPDPPFVPGMECAGEIVELGSAVSGLSVGAPIMVGAKGGGFAEQIIVAASAVTPLPAALSYDEGACWQVAASTAWHGLHDKAKLQSGETILVLGASGGVGMAAVKLAKYIGATVIAAASSEPKRVAARVAGADHMLDPADPDLASRVKALTNGRGCDVVFDPVGGELAIASTHAIGWGGRYLIVGFASGKVPSFSASHALIKGYSLIGLRAGEASRRDPELRARTQTALLHLAQSGIMRPQISHRLPLDQTADVLRTLEQKMVVGRAIICMS